MERVGPPGVRRQRGQQSSQVCEGAGAWTPEEHVNSLGVISPVKFWINIWTDGNKLSGYQWPEHIAMGQPPPPITEDQVVKSSKLFPENTSGSPDGWHPRHYSLSKKGTQKVVDMLNAIEREGMLPYQMEIV